MSDKPTMHRNDMYGDLDSKEEKPAVPAATVVLLRDGEAGMEVLMLKKNSKIAFGGMWVFPGGRIDDEDFSEDSEDLESAARAAAVREAKEEAGIDLDPANFQWFAHWTPPANTPVRFATWFFVAQAPRDGKVLIDDGEIKDHQWIKPADALARHGAGEIDLVPPTWVTLYHLSRHGPSEKAMRHFANRDIDYYTTRVALREDGVRVAMWSGDAGYDTSNPNADGEHHRLVMAEGEFEFIHSNRSY